MAKLTGSGGSGSLNYYFAHLTADVTLGNTAPLATSVLSLTLPSAGTYLLSCKTVISVTGGSGSPIAASCFLWFDDGSGFVADSTMAFDPVFDFNSTQGIYNGNTYFTLTNADLPYVAASGGVVITLKGYLGGNSLSGACVGAPGSNGRTYITALKIG